MSTDPKQAKLDEELKISNHDKDILNRIFNPGLPYGDYQEEDQVEAEQAEPVSEADSEKVMQVKQLETNAVQAAETGDLQMAMDLLNEAAVLYPEWASTYNNRAQVLRLRGDVKGAVEDLNTAIQLSGGRGPAACQAFTQRGLILRLEGDDNQAAKDFKEAAHLGSEFAKQQVIALNPYAALCNQMLGEVMQKIRLGEQ